jgi:hypothetical protein
MMKSIYTLAAAVTLLALPLPALAAPIPAVMFKNPTCSCCETYAAYLEQNGFKVELKPTNDLSQISQEFGVPATLEGCHTIVMGNGSYVVAGFVPVDIVNKMLTEHPNITGVALPGMPNGSPGMGGVKTESFTVYAFTRGKAPTVYAVE